MAWKAVTITILILSVLLHLSSSYPARSDSIPINKLIFSPPNEVDVPSSIIESLPGKLPPINNGGPSKDKRNGIFMDNSNSCCPSIVELIEPMGAKNKTGDLVELYQEGEFHQRFYEISCAPNVVDLPCRYLDHEHKVHSKCVQQYSYTYALVRDFGVDYDDVDGGGWRLEHIQVRSGCSCQVGHSGRHHHRNFQFNGAS